MDGSYSNSDEEDNQANPVENVGVSDDELSAIDDEESENEDDDETAAFRKELADIPLGELTKLKETVGLKRYSEAMFGAWKPQSLIVEEASKETVTNKNKRKSDKSSVSQPEGENNRKSSKSAPEEKSSKNFVDRPRRVVHKVGRTKRDPRFDDLSGNYNEDLFKKSYTFVEDMRKEELKTVKKQLKKTKGKGEREDLENLVQRMEQKDKGIKAKEKQKEKERKRKHSELQSVQKGKKAYYLKKSDQKKIELAEKYRELKSSGQLDKYLGKKFKRNAAKEKRNLPPKENH